LYRSAEGYRRVVAHYDATLEEMGIPYTARIVETRYGPRHTVVSGSRHRKPVVLWHGLNANAASWAQWIPALAPRYRVYAVDAIGGMGKSAPTRPDKKGTAYGEWALEVLKGLDLKRANMVGASNGGWMIVKLASVAPKTVGCAVLMSSAGLRPLDYWAALRTIPKVLCKTPDEMACRLLEAVSAPNAPADPFFLAYFQLMIESGFRSERLAPTLRDEEIRCLTAPTCLLMAQYEASFNPYKAIKRGVRLLPNVITAEIVPGVGHSLVHREPDWVIARAMRFLAQYAVEAKQDRDQEDR
jgi:pimeloyl-ACP methyl ester carboxylesterase